MHPQKRDVQLDKKVLERLIPPVGGRRKIYFIFSPYFFVSETNKKGKASNERDNQYEIFFEIVIFVSFVLAFKKTEMVMAKAAKGH